MKTTFQQFMEELKKRRPALFKRGPITPKALEEILHEAFVEGWGASVEHNAESHRISPLEEHSPHRD